MATRQQIEQALNNPNVRKMLNLIAATEGVKHDYNTLFGNQRINNLNAHPNIRKAFRQTNGKTNYTTAAGRYQFLNGTWNNLAKRYGFRDFSAKNQDLGAVALIAGRGALNDVVNGNWQTAISKLGKEWASLPSSTYAQNKRGWDFVNKHLGSNITGLPQQQAQQRARPISASQFNQITQQRSPLVKLNELQSQQTPQRSQLIKIDSLQSNQTANQQRSQLINLSDSGIT